MEVENTNNKQGVNEHLPCLEQQPIFSKDIFFQKEFFFQRLLLFFLPGQGRCPIRSGAGFRRDGQWGVQGGRRHGQVVAVVGRSHHRRGGSHGRGGGRTRVRGRGGRGGGASYLQTQRGTGQKTSRSPVAHGVGVHVQGGGVAVGVEGGAHRTVERGGGDRVVHGGKRAMFQRPTEAQRRQHFDGVVLALGAFPRPVVQHHAVPLALVPVPAGLDQPTDRTRKTKRHVGRKRGTHAVTAEVHSIAAQGEVGVLDQPHGRGLDQIGHFGRAHVFEYLFQVGFFHVGLMCRAVVEPD